MRRLSFGLCLLFSLSVPAQTDLERTGTKRLEWVAKRQPRIQEVLDAPLSIKERQALRGLLGCTPLSDFDETAGDRGLADVRASLHARETTPWGPSIPKELFERYVLPARVYLEPSSPFRTTHHLELLERVRGLSMAKAALEINYWCLSRATFSGTDPRTASVQGTLMLGSGRCTELSVLLVSALRAVALPARLALVPNWSHQDSYHAWVEVWVDGRWHFMGASEPAPKLDQAWFRGTSTRAPRIVAWEPVPASEDASWQEGKELDRTGDYALTHRLEVQVRAESGKPVPGARVDVMVGSDGGLKSIVGAETDARGRAIFSLGPSDAFIWAHHEGRFGGTKAPRGASRTIDVILGEAALATPLDLDLEVAPEPVAQTLDTPKDPHHEARVSTADSARNALRSKGLDAAKAREVAQSLGYPERISAKLRSAGANWPVLVSFLKHCGPAKRAPLALLESLTAKDCSEVTLDVLLDHLPLETQSTTPPEITTVIAPRVDDEPLGAHRTWLRTQIPADLARQASSAPEALITWFLGRVQAPLASTRFTAPMSPRTAFTLGTTDPHSRDICFIALWRAIGLPGQLDPLTRRPMILKEGRWKFVCFESARAREPETGWLRLARPIERSPVFGAELSIVALRAGAWTPLQLPPRLPLHALPSPLPLPAGSYVLVTNHRLEDGTALARLTRFEVKAGSVVEVPVVLRTAPQPPSSLTRSR